MTSHSLIIVGSGPAGYTAAIYAARAALSPVVIEGSVTSGGALMNTTEVENFPGFTQGIMGPDLMLAMREQAQKFGANLISDDAIAIGAIGLEKEVSLGNGTKLTASALILAMGSDYRELGLKDEKRLSGHGVSWCATCDGFFFKEQDVAVVGGGDSALEEAMFLTKFARSVTVIVRRDRLRASKIMQERAKANTKIRFTWNAHVSSLHGDTKLSGVDLAFTDGSREHLPITGLFIAIGHDPRSILIRDQVLCDDGGYVKVDHPSTKTSIEGVFACGDLVDHHYRQAITAAGSGCAAALDAERFLASNTVY